MPVSKDVRPYVQGLAGHPLDGKPPGIDRRIDIFYVNPLAREIGG
jgi:hypothetical protein